MADSSSVAVGSTYFFFDFSATRLMMRRIVAGIVMMPAPNMAIDKMTESAAIESPTTI